MGTHLATRDERGYPLPRTGYKERPRLSAEVGDSRNVGFIGFVGSGAKKVSSVFSQIGSSPSVSRLVPVGRVLYMLVASFRSSLLEFRA